MEKASIKLNIYNSMLQVKIKFRSKIFNLVWFLISFAFQP